VTTATVTGDPSCPRCGSFRLPGSICPCWQQPAPGWTPPTFPTFTAPPRLSDEDVDRIARRVVEMLREAPP
jgi:hypothetical protein